MKKEAVWGAAAPRMRTMLAGLLTKSCTWLKKLPARKVAKKMVSTCTGTLELTCRVPAKHLQRHRGEHRRARHATRWPQSVPRQTLAQTEL